MDNVLSEHTAEIMRKYRICIIVTSYNNKSTINDVVSAAESVSPHVIVVLDGEPAVVVRSLEQHVSRQTVVLAFDKNRGKGDALKEGFKKAILMGYEYAITIDGSGQYYPEDICSFTEAFLHNKGAFIIGQRSQPAVGASMGRSLAVRFCNFSYYFQTGHRVSDSLCGFRLYPLSMLDSRWKVTSRYYSELEFLIYAAWKRVRIVCVPVRTHDDVVKLKGRFHSVIDFCRIFTVNVIFLAGSVFYYLPVRLVAFWRSLR